jgi:hypothetical protein
MRMPLPTGSLKIVRRVLLASACAVLLGSPAVTTFAGTPTPTPEPINGSAPAGSNPPAARYYGAVTDSSGNPVADGTQVMAMSSSGATCGQVNVGDAPATDGNYALDDMGGDPGCSTPGSAITFSVGGATASPSGDTSVPDGSGAIHVDLSTP